MLKNIFSGSSEEESDDRSTPDPNPEPTWMEDLSYTIQQTTWVILMSHQFRITLSLERKQFHPSSLSWKKPFLVVSVPNQVSPAWAGQWWRHPPTPLSPTLSVRYADSSSSEDHSDFVLLDRETEENWKIHKNHKLFLFAFKQGFRYYFRFKPVFVKF